MFLNFLYDFGLKDDITRCAFEPFILKNKFFSFGVISSKLLERLNNGAFSAMDTVSWPGKVYLMFFFGDLDIKFNKELSWAIENSSLAE